MATRPNDEELVHAAERGMQEIETPSRETSTAVGTTDIGSMPSPIKDVDTTFGSPESVLATETKPSGILDDIVVAIFGVGLGEPFCHAGADKLLDGNLWGLVGFAIGLPAMIAGISYHFWKRGLGERTLQFARESAWRWWPAAVFLAFVTIVGPDIYRRATETSTHEPRRIGIELLPALSRVHQPPRK